jgi:hypothetical protein
MKLVLSSLAICLILSSASAHAASCQIIMDRLQDKDFIVSLVGESAGHHVYKFVKDLPILGYRITSSRFSDLPPQIREVLGAVDATQYTEEYLGKNIGSVIALQMNGDNPDFYVIGKETYDAKYKQVEFAQVTEKNAKLVNKLKATSAGAIVNSGDPNVVALLKTVPVEMVRMSQLGYPIDKQVTIESPWGEQTKPAGQDAFLTFDAGKKQYYMINAGENGLPIGYVLSRPEGTQPKDFVTATVAASQAPVYNFVKDLPILGYRITSSRFSDLPPQIREVLGAVDATQYTEEYLGKNIGSMIALQMNGDNPDFYVIGKETYDAKYKQVNLVQVFEKNSKLVGKLSSTPAGKLIKTGDINLVGALKTVPVEMVKMSELGYPIHEAVTIESPWGEQTKPAGQDAFLTFDAGKNQYYMINADSQGLPLSYIPAQR